MVWRCTQTGDFPSTIWWHHSCLALERESMPFHHPIRHGALLVLFQPCLLNQLAFQKRLIYRHLLSSPLLFLHWHHLHHHCLHHLLDLAIIIYCLPLYYNKLNPQQTYLYLTPLSQNVNTQHWNQFPACQAGQCYDFKELSTNSYSQ